MSVSNRAVRSRPLAQVPQVLRNKAALRNPDEFYFAMEKARTRDGVHISRSVPAAFRTPPTCIFTRPDVNAHSSSQQRTHTAEELHLMKVRVHGTAVSAALSVRFGR